MICKKKSNNAGTLEISYLCNHHWTENNKIAKFTIYETLGCICHSFLTTPYVVEKVQSFYTTFLENVLYISTNNGSISQVRIVGTPCILQVEAILFQSNVKGSSVQRK